METISPVRIDKFLWAVRLFKTRSLASEACQKGKVQINGQQVKSSRFVKIDEVVFIKEGPVFKQYKILNISGKRMGAKLTPDFIAEVTPQEDLDMLEMSRLANSLNRARGTGRPTKKDRRDLEDFFSI